MNIFPIKRNDTRPAIVATLNDAEGPIPLAGCTVQLLLAGVLETRKTMDLDADIIDEVDAIVTHLWEPEDTDTAGFYLAEWQITLADGNVVTVANAGYDGVWIREDLGPPTGS